MGKLHLLLESCLPFTAFCQNRIISGYVSGYASNYKVSQKKNTSNGVIITQNYFNGNASYLQKNSENGFVGGQVTLFTRKYSDLRPDSNNILVPYGKNTKEVSVEFSGVARSIFLKKGDFTLFGTHSIGYEASQSIEESSTKKVKYTGNTFRIYSSLGVNYEINPHWFLTTSFGYLGYEFTKRKDLSTSEINNDGRFDANFGLSSFGIGAEYHF